MLRRNALKLIIVALMIAASIILLMLSQDVIEEQIADNLAVEEYETIREYAVQDGEVTTTPDQIEMQEGINFDALFAINPDTVGWIIVSGTDINYPIVQGTDNAHYLTHTFMGTQNPSGTIFLDYRDRSGIIGRARIYGHNMRNGTMFGTLAQWQGYEIIIYTPEMKTEYTVTWRGALPAKEVAQLGDNTLILITCVRNSPDIRYVVIAEKHHTDE